MKNLFILSLTTLLILLGTLHYSFAQEKENIPPDQVGYALGEWLKKDMSKDQNQAWFKETIKVVDNPRIFRQELRFLKIFAVDLAIGNSAYDDTSKQSIRTVFLQKIGSPKFYLSNRVVDYFLALNTPHHRGPAWTVVKQFMIFCGYQLDAVLMLDISTEFMATREGAKTFLKSVSNSIAERPIDMNAIEFNGEIYNDDRMFVLYICKCTFNIDDDIVETIIYHEDAPENHKLCLVTYRNIARYIASRVDHFNSEEKAQAYLKKIEPQVPLISLGGKSPIDPLPYDQLVKWKRRNKFKEYDYEKM